MYFYLGFLLGLLFAIYVLPIGESISQLVISKLNIYIAKNTLESNKYTVESQKLASSLDIEQDVIGFKCQPKDDLLEDFDEDDEY